MRVRNPSFWAANIPVVEKRLAETRAELAAGTSGAPAPVLRRIIHDDEERLKAAKDFVAIATEGHALAVAA